MADANIQEKKPPVLSGIHAYCKPVLFGILAGVGTIFVLTGAAALLFAVLRLTSAAIPAAAVFIVTIGGFITGFLAAKISGKRGLLVGGCAALMVAILLLAAGCMFSGVPQGTAYTRTAVITAAGMLGGYLGVGGKNRTYH